MEFLLNSAHPETSVFGCALSAISFRLSAKDIKNNVLADCCPLTAESSIQKLVVSGWTLNRKGFNCRDSGLLEPVNAPDAKAPMIYSLGNWDATTVT